MCGFFCFAVFFINSPQRYNKNCTYANFCRIYSEKNIEIILYICAVSRRLCWHKPDFSAYSLESGHPKSHRASIGIICYKQRNRPVEELVSFIFHPICALFAHHLRISPEPVPNQSRTNLVSISSQFRVNFESISSQYHRITITYP